MQSTALLGGAFRLSINLFVGDGVLDVPFGNVTNSPNVEKNCSFYRRVVGDADPYDLNFWLF